MSTFLLVRTLCLGTVDSQPTGLPVLWTPGWVN